MATDDGMSDLSALARRVLELAAEKNLSVVTAESCTAGKLCALLSEGPGAATHLQGGFVTYTKTSKRHALGVSQALLEEKGAVCCDVAAAMARGAFARSPADLAVSITGVAGPEPDEDGNPVGRVCIGLAREEGMHEWEFHYGDLGRDVIQARAMQDALKLVIAAMEAA
jgi:nicotinamide-nucleotide amidase